MAGRQQFQEELRELEVQALGGIDLVVKTLDRTLEALEHQDIELASIVIHDDDRIDGRYLEVQQGILSLLALQSPVASDLRLVAAEGLPEPAPAAPGAPAAHRHRPAPAASPRAVVAPWRGRIAATTPSRCSPWRSPGPPASAPRRWRPCSRPRPP